MGIKGIMQRSLNGIPSCIHFLGYTLHADMLSVHRYSAGEQAHILFSVGIKNATELSSLIQRLNDKNMPTQDLSNIEAAQVSGNKLERHHKVQRTPA